MSGQCIIKLSQGPAINSKAHYENKALGLSIGVSDSTDATKNTVPYGCDEFMFIIEGSVNLQNKKTAHSDTLKVGESVVIPNGYDYQWHQQGYLRKLYVALKGQKSNAQLRTEGIVYIDEKSDVPWQKTSDGHRKKILYQNHNQCFTSGVWQSNTLTTGLINFPYHEFILIHSGSLICIDDRGVTHSFKPAEALFIPQGTACSWQVKDKVSIYYVQIKSP